MNFKGRLKVSITSKIGKTASSVVMLLTVVSCGGGGAATGGNTEFSVIPDNWTLSAAKGNTSCAVDSLNPPKITVTILGGTPPYRIINSKPDKLSISVDYINEKNPSFIVSALGGCGDSLNILILDSVSRSINFQATIEAGEDLTAATTP